MKGSDAVGRDLERSWFEVATRHNESHMPSSKTWYLRHAHLNLQKVYSYTEAHALPTLFALPHHQG